MGERALEGRRTAARLAAHQGQLDRGRYLGGDARHRGQTDSRSAGGVTPSSVIPGRVEDANPESRNSPMCNCTSEVWSFGPSRNDDSNTGPLNGTSHGPRP